MKNTFEYSFDDEAADKFCYDMANKKMEIYFSGYIDLITKERLLYSPCIFKIQNWVRAKCFVGDNKKRYNLDQQMGIVEMILYMKKIGDDLEIMVMTLDGRYLTIFFSEPDIDFVLENSSKKAFIFRLWNSIFRKQK